MQAKDFMKRAGESPPLVIEGRRMTYDECQQLLIEMHDRERLWRFCRNKRCKRHRRCCGTSPETMDHAFTEELFYILLGLVMGRTPPEFDKVFPDLPAFLKHYNARWVPQRLAELRRAPSR